MQKKSKIPSLFHYTTQAGLSGVIDSKSLWFTDIFYLNDATEIEYTFILVQDELEKKIVNLGGLISPDDDLIIHFMKDSAHYEFISESAGFYVFYFSKKPDDLSQWRAYRDDGGGYCIEFDSNEMSKIAKEKELIKATCLYDEEKQREEIESIIDKTYAACKENDIIELIKIAYQAIRTTKLKPEQENKLHTIQMEFIRRLLILALKLKHEKFCDEAELRMYTVVAKSKGMSLKFRLGKTMLIPYQNIKIAENDKKMPIKRIIIGPTNHPKLSKIAVEDLLMANYIDCEVILSKMPYRSKL